MEDNMNRKAALENYDSLCKTLDEIGWKYKKDDEKLAVSLGVSGEDLPMEFSIIIDESRQLIRIISLLPFRFNEKTLIEGAIATSQVNYLLADGSFDYDLSDGSVLFRMTASFRDSLISKLLFVQLIRYSCYVVDKYNDMFMMLAKGLVDIKKFFEMIA